MESFAAADLARVIVDVAYSVVGFTVGFIYAVRLQQRRNGR